MSSTNKTLTIELSQYVGTDKPTYLTDYNGDMLKIDNAIAADRDSIATAQSKADGADAKADTNAGAIATLDGQINNASNGLTKRVTDVEGDVNTIESLIGNGTPTTTDKTIIGAINELNGEMPDNASDVAYDNTSSGLTADDVQEAIDELKSDIDNIVSGATVLAEVTADGVKTVSALLDELYALVPNDTGLDVLGKTRLVAPSGATFAFKGFTNSNISYHDFYVSMSVDNARLDSIVLQASNSIWRYATLATTGNTFSTDSSTPTSGQKIQIIVLN